MFDPEGKITHVVIAFIDISREGAAEAAKEELTQRRHHTERLESVGTLAAGIAHDFNNLLSVVKMVAEKIRRVEAHPEKLRDLEKIDQATESAAALTRGLLSFAGRLNRGTRPVPVSAIVQRVADVVSRTLDRRIEVTVDLGTRRTVIGDESNFEQVVMNLMINARDAMPEGGLLELRTRDAGGKLVLEISDTGEGIPAEIRPRIFEPYFTTKANSAAGGTGLGLATVHGIVQLSSGTIEVLDHAPKGTTMRLTFPAAP